LYLNLSRANIQAPTNKMGFLLNAVVLGYFISHIPITFFFDGQGLLKGKTVAGVPVIPQQLVDLQAWYCQQYADPLICAKPQQPAWFRAVITAELFLQLPFFFVAVYGWMKRREWLRIPLVIYGSHVATTLIPIYGELYQSWINKKLDDGQFTFLASVYAPYLLIPLFLVWYGSTRQKLFDEGEKSAATTQKKRQ
jgi:EXPERA (EXPanded EBP superfamily)